MQLSEVGGSETNREVVSFRSCVRASGRGEAKLRAGVRGCASQWLGVSTAQSPARHAAPRRVLGARALPCLVVDTVSHCFALLNDSLTILTIPSEPQAIPKRFQRDSGHFPAFPFPLGPRGAVGHAACAMLRPARYFWSRALPKRFPAIPSELV